MSALQFILMSVLLVVASPSFAHRGHDTLSIVTIAPGGGVSVSHRFEAHDLEPALAIIAPEAQPNLDDPAAITALEAYVMRRFTLSVGTRSVPLLLRGTIVTGQDVRVELIGKLPRGTRAVQVRSTLLTDAFPRQQHQVNVRVGKSVRTLRFSGGGTQGMLLR